MQYSAPLIERSKPLFGTVVRVRAQSLRTGETENAIGRCFDELTQIHNLMSFQERGSDVSRLNRSAHRRAVRVDPRTYEVLRFADELSRGSAGVFDVTIAPLVVASRAAIAPYESAAPDPQARYRDIELLPECFVRFARPLWLDLSGVAKGYAVDRAVEMLCSITALQTCVNAGGDLRVAGPLAEWVRLGVDLSTESTVPAVQLRNESMASSGWRPTKKSIAEYCAVAHIDGDERLPAPTRVVAVLAERCIVADALTKVVMARGSAAAPVLSRYAARGLMSDDALGWQEVA
jgi:thiamine biosynthesis lipoprotein